MKYDLWTCVTFNEDKNKCWAERDLCENLQDFINGRYLLQLTRW